MAPGTWNNAFLNVDKFLKLGTKPEEILNPLLYEHQNHEKTNKKVASFTKLVMRKFLMLFFYILSNQWVYFSKLKILNSI